MGILLLLTPHLLFLQIREFWEVNGVEGIKKKIEMSILSFSSPSFSSPNLIFKTWEGFKTSKKSERIIIPLLTLYFPLSTNFQSVQA